MDWTGSLIIETQSVDGTVTLAVSGELDMATRDRLLGALEWLEANGEEAITVDLTGLSFIDATGLHALIRARDSARMRGATLEFRNPSPAVRRLISLVGPEGLVEEVGDGD
ncbi:MAG TPA: STAS domain-containing protein [Actinomycetota bacterium]|nr:STAS domain-containing protein [Actinomycetota bacterium]